MSSRHFISGKPAALEDETNPDWLPTLNLGHSKVSESQVRIGGERWSRKKAREDARSLTVATSSTADAIEELLSLASPANEPEVDTSVETSVQTDLPSNSDASIQTDLWQVSQLPISYCMSLYLCSTQIGMMQSELNTCYETIRNLRKKISHTTVFSYSVHNTLHQYFHILSSMTMVCHCTAENA